MYSFCIVFRFDRWDLFWCCLGGGEGEAKPGGKKKFITRDEEPEQ